MTAQKVRRLTAEELDNVAGGFDFDEFYYAHKRELNIKCPVCGAEGTLKTIVTGYDGYADGSFVAVDNSICTNCGTQVDIKPERNQLVVVSINEATNNYSEQIFPLNW